MVFQVYLSLNCLNLFLTWLFEHLQYIIYSSVTILAFAWLILKRIGGTDIAALKWVGRIFMHRFGIKRVLASFRGLTLFWSFLKWILLKWISWRLKRIYALKRIHFAFNTWCFEWIGGFLTLYFLMFSYLSKIPSLKFLVWVFLTTLEIKRFL